MDVATPKFELGTWDRKWISRMAEGVGKFSRMSLKSGRQSRVFRRGTILLSNKKKKETANLHVISINPHQHQTAISTLRRRPNFIPFFSLRRIFRRLFEIVSPDDCNVRLEREELDTARWQVEFKGRERFY